MTETIESPGSIRFSNTAIIAVQDPAIIVSKGSTFAWLLDATRVYDDERLDEAPIKKLIESEIEKNLRAKGV
ncbi:MAG: hypothetical protein RQ982_11640, partial [Gammaproteobacteria bacterium]|nr:hypothetical protein [Gammaproteobacteria bacterium]